jgi:hypothetical protein
MAEVRLTYPTELQALSKGLERSFKILLRSKLALPLEVRKKLISLGIRSLRCKRGAMMRGQHFMDGSDFLGTKSTACILVIKVAAFNRPANCTGRCF